MRHKVQNSPHVNAVCSLLVHPFHTLIPYHSTCITKETNFKSCVYTHFPAQGIN